MSYEEFVASSRSVKHGLILRPKERFLNILYIRKNSILHNDVFLMSESPTFPQNLGNTLLLSLIMQRELNRKKETVIFHWPTGSGKLFSPCTLDKVKGDITGNLTRHLYTVTPCVCSPTLITVTRGQVDQQTCQNGQQAVITCNTAGAKLFLNQVDTAAQLANNQDAYVLGTAPTCINGVWMTETSFICAGNTVSVRPIRGEGFFLG